MDKRKKKKKQQLANRKNISICCHDGGTESLSKIFSGQHPKLCVWWKTNTVYCPNRIIIPHGREVREEEVHLPARQIEGQTKIQ